MILKKHLKNLKPGTILVKELGKEDKTETASGIYMGESESEKNISGLTIGEVVDVGENFLNYEMKCKKGDKILVKESILEKGDSFYFIGDDKFYILSENDYYYGTVDE